MQINKKKIGLALRSERLKQNLTQAQVSQKMGNHSRPYVSKLELGGATIPAINAYAKILQVSAMELLIFSHYKN